MPFLPKNRHLAYLAYSFKNRSYDIAKGMEYLSFKSIMHGDLATRNILIGSLDGSAANPYIAKVADFGLSKSFYEHIFYKKEVRTDVPWRQGDQMNIFKSSQKCQM